MNQHPLLSVVVVTSEHTAGMSRLLDALEKQTCDPSQLELIVVDLATSGPDRLSMPAGISFRRLVCPAASSWMQARLAGASAALAPWVAFLGDHFVPDAHWASVMLRAIRSAPCCALGSTFTNASTDSWWTRAALVADYGHHLHPYHGPTETFPAGSCVTYPRSFLISIHERITASAGVDFNILERMHRDGMPLRVVADAVLGHLAFASSTDMMMASFHHARLLAASRMEQHSWNLPHRIARATAAVSLVPLLQWWRMARRLARQPRGLRLLLAALPAVIPATLAASLGEASGLLLGARSSPRRFMEIELGAPRIH
jgi:hypothetical protein